MTWWYCTNRSNGEKYVWIDAERWVDARTKAEKILGAYAVWVTTPKTEQATPPKLAYTERRVYEVRWTGSAAGANTLRLEAKRVLIQKLLCKGCGGLLWPWEVEVIAGENRHIVFYERSPGDPPGNGWCGPAITRKGAESKRNTSSLPDAVPYEKEL